MMKLLFGMALPTALISKIFGSLVEERSAPDWVSRDVKNLSGKVIASP